MSEIEEFFETFRKFLPKKEFNNADILFKAFVHNFKEILVYHKRLLLIFTLVAKKLKNKKKIKLN